MLYFPHSGPLNNTIDDFWKMVHQQRARVIVMVTNLTENGKEKVSKKKTWEKKA